MDRGVVGNSRGLDRASADIGVGDAELDLYEIRGDVGRETIEIKVGNRGVGRGKILA